MIRRGGLVCGAVFDGEFHVVHALSDEIAPMRKSKYVQSRLGACLEEMERALKEGREVLFTGTPCQCHGVKRLFGAYPGLILMSLVCRGVQPPALWEEYKAWLERDGKLTAFCFRDKRRRNDAHTVSCTVGGAEREDFFNRDPFCRIYTKCLALRPSCYRCPYCFPDREFDFTVGDFWGIGEVVPELADGKGVSLVLTGSERAGEAIESLGAGATVVEVAPERALQEALRQPAKETMLRRFFFLDFARKGDGGTCDMALLLKKYGS